MNFLCAQIESGQNEDNNQAEIRNCTSSHRGQFPWMKWLKAAAVLVLSGLSPTLHARADTLAVSGPLDNKIYYVFSDGSVSALANINVYPEGVAFGPSGTSIYVANWGGNLINRVTSMGSVVTWVTNIVDPYGLAFDSKSNLFVACCQINRVRRVSPAKDVTDFAAVSGAYGLAIDAADNLYVSGSSTRLTKVLPDGSASAFGPYMPGGGLRGVAVDANGYVYVASLSGTITKISPAGEGGLFASGLSSPVGLAFDNVGNLYAANFNTKTVSRIDTNGLVTSFATIPGGAKWVAVYPVPKFHPGPVAISLVGEAAVLTWTGNFILQSASEAGGPYSDVSAAGSPHTNTIVDGPEKFFRLRN